EGGDFSYCVMVRRGAVVLQTDFPQAPRIALGAGDAVSISGRAAHAFTSADIARAAQPLAFERHALPPDGRTGEVELVIGVAPNQQLALGTVLAGPIVVRPAEYPDLSRRLWRA